MHVSGYAHSSSAHSTILVNQPQNNWQPPSLVWRMVLAYFFFPLSFFAFFLAFLISASLLAQYAFHAV